VKGKLSSGMTVGDQIGLCYNPEFIALGSVLHDMQYPDMQLLGTSSAEHAKVLQKVLKSITRKTVEIRTMSLTEAELVKIAVNNFVTAKISFANMMLQITSKLKNVNVDEVCEAIGLDSRIGARYMRGGTPYGGPCFPRDTKAMVHLLKKLGIANPIPAAINLSNSFHLNFLIDYIVRSYPKRKIGIIGLSYKAFTSVCDASPGIELLRGLRDLGIETYGWDPVIKNVQGLDYEDLIIADVSDFIAKTEITFITRLIPDISDNLIDEIQQGTILIDLWRQVS
jgi:UDPglucose 6-dehydrogenase